MRVAVMISGRGSNLGALIEAAAPDDFPARIVLVVSSNPDAGGLDLARAADIPSTVIVPGRGSAKAAAEQNLDQALRDAGVELICLAGYMHLLSADFVERWRDRIINIHPSLLPSFKGLGTHQRALDAGVRIHGCTVHYVRADVDSGPIIAQAAVSVRASDDAESLAARVLAAEHRLYPSALAAVASGAIRVVSDRIDGRTPEADTSTAIFSPHLGD